MSKEPTAADHSEVSAPACDSAAQKGALWLKAQMREDGSLRHASSLSDYYKVCYGLAVTGHNAATERMLDYFAGRFLKENGDLDGTGCPWFEDFRIYAHGWIIVAAMARGRFDIAYPILRFLSTFHDSRSGGFFTTAEGREQGDGSQEIMTTAMAGIACIWGGRLDLARATGTWMRNLYDEQPDLSRRLCFVWHSRDGLVADFPENRAKEYCVSTSEVSQRYYQYGIAAAFLTSLQAATGEQVMVETVSTIPGGDPVLRRGCVPSAPKRENWVGGGLDVSVDERSQGSWYCGSCAGRITGSAKPDGLVERSQCLRL